MTTTTREPERQPGHTHDIPHAGNLGDARAEKLVEQLGITRSLERRFARLDEVQALWRKPAAKEQPNGGVFAHLKPKAVALPPMNAQGGKLTFVKFQTTVLEHAHKIEIRVGSIGNFAAILTALHEDAPPILQWDSPERRNPFSHYVYQQPSPAAQWGLAPGWLDVSAVVMSPEHWHGQLKHHALAAMFVIAGARDHRTSQGNALFPEDLKSELHEVRSTIAAYSKTAPIHGLNEASVCGLWVPPNVLVSVTDSANVSTTYEIDRWD